MTYDFVWCYGENTTQTGCDTISSKCLLLTRWTPIFWIGGDGCAWTRLFWWGNMRIFTKLRFSANQFLARPYYSEESIYTPLLLIKSALIRQQTRTHNIVCNTTPTFSSLGSKAAGACLGKVFTRTLLWDWCTICFVRSMKTSIGRGVNELIPDQSCFRILKHLNSELR